MRSLDDCYNVFSWGCLEVKDAFFLVFDDLCRIEVSLRAGKSYQN